VGVPRVAKRDQLVGQQSVVEEIRAKLLSGQRACIGQAVVIPGAGGLGKTQLAVEYVDRYGATYSGGVIWLQADAQLDMQLLVLAQDAGWFPAGTDPKLLIDMARQRLRSRPNCLLVFDNLEQLQDIQPYLPPQTASTHILATSRNVQQAFMPIELKLLTPELALKLLVQEAGRSPQGPAEQEAAQDIANRLAGLPLALELAGRKLQHLASLTFAQYRDLLAANGLAALPEVLAGQPALQQRNINAVLQVSEQVLADSPRLREVLDVLTHSGTSSVGRSLLAALLDVTEVDLSEPLAVGDTLKLLELDPSSRSGDPSRPRIHRLVSEARRKYVSADRVPGGPAALCDRLADWLSSRREDFGHRAAFEAELEALRTWQQYATQHQLPQQVRLLWLQAYPPYHHGQYAQATKWLTQALTCTGNDPGLSAELLGHLHSDLGSCCFAAGQYDQALRHAQEALTLRKQSLGDVHPDVATSLSNLGSTYLALGKYRLAQEYEEEALILRNKSLGDAHPAVATSLNNLGATYRAQGKYKVAQGYQEKALTLRRQSLGEAHPDVATSLNNLGGTYSDQGNHKVAQEYQEKALTLRRQSLGEAHPDVATSLNNLGATYFAQGKYKDAQECQEKALTLLRQSFGEANPKVATSLDNVGATYRAQGKYKAAQEYQEKALTLRR
jgi:tetratricopeptide (TPR) repeat protein